MWQLVGLAACSALIVLAATSVFTADENNGPDLLATTVISSAATETSIGTTIRGWGTQITVELDGLPHRAVYRLWAIDSDGAWSSAGSWAPTATGRARLTGGTEIPVEDIDRLVVTSNDKGDVLVEASPGG